MSYKKYAFKIISVLILFTFCSFFGISIGKTSKKSVADSYKTDYSVIFSYYSLESCGEGPFLVFSPSGENVEIDDNKFFLEELGRYLIYSNNSKVCEVVSLSSDLKEKTESLFKGSKILSVKANVDFSDVNPNSKNGIEIVMAGEDSSFIYQKVIDLEKLNKTDYLFSLFAERSERSVMGDLKVSLIDVNDPKNVVSVSFRQSTEHDNVTYITIQFNGYSIALPCEGSAVNVRAEGAANMRTSFVLNDISEPLGITFDCSENAFYKKNGQLVLDLDDATILLGRTPFKGFTENKVYLKFETTATHSCVFIQDIDGKEAGDLEGLTQNNNYFLRTFYDGIYYRGNVLNDGVIGKEYSLPELKSDCIFDSSITVSEKLYALRNEKWVNISDTVSGGKFYPDSTGYYKIEYIAKGEVVGKAERIFYFQIKESVEEIRIICADFSEDIMEEIEIPEFTCYGGSGILRAEVKCFYNGVEITPDINNKILLDKMGNVMFEITVKDFLGTIVTKNVVVTVIGKPILQIEEIPVSVQAGKEYEVSAFSAINYAVDVNDEHYFMQKTVKVNGIEVGENGTFTPERDVPDIRIEYIAGMGTEYEIVKEVRIPVLTIEQDASIFPVKDYFIKDGIDMTLFDSGIKCDFSTDASFSLPNAMPVSNFGFSLAFMSSSNTANKKELYQFSAIDISLTDCVDPSKVVTLNLSSFKWIPDLDSVTLTLNKIYKRSVGYSKGVFDGDFKSQNYYGISLRIDALNSMILSGSGAVISFIDYYDDGRAFEGFTDGIAKVSFRFIGVEQESSVVIMSLGNQAFNTYALADGDFQGPEIGLSRAFQRSYEKGQTVTIPAAVSYDFFSGKIKHITLGVTSPSKKVSRYDATRENDILFDESGRYIFEFTAYDDVDNKNGYSFTVSVTEKDYCFVVITDKVKSEYKVGESFIRPKYILANVLESNVQIFIRDLFGRLILVTGDYVFSKSGAYKIIVKAIGASGISTTESFYVAVSA